MEGTQLCASFEHPSSLRSCSSAVTLYSVRVLCHAGRRGTSDCFLQVAALQTLAMQEAREITQTCMAATSSRHLLAMP